MTGTGKLETDDAVIAIEADEYDQMWRSAKAAGDPLADIEQVEEFLYHDGVVIDAVRDSNGGLWLRNSAMTQDPGPPGPRRIVSINHFLRYDDIETMRSTLHEEQFVTMTSYDRASAIVLQTIAYDAVAGGPSRNHRYRSNEVNRNDLDRDHLPDECMLPGRSMRFRLEDGPFSKIEGNSAIHHNHPVPEDRIIAVIDCPRIWMGRFPRPSTDPHVHMVVCVDDADGVWTQHRLSFRDEDEAAIDETLAAGWVPTLDTYRLAKRIVRESYLPQEDGSTDLLVETLSMDTLAGQAPTYVDVATHDAEWPQFANRKER